MDSFLIIANTYNMYKCINYNNVLLNYITSFHLEESTWNYFELKA